MRCLRQKARRFDRRGPSFLSDREISVGHINSSSAMQVTRPTEKTREMDKAPTDEAVPTPDKPVEMVYMVRRRALLQLAELQGGEARSVISELGRTRNYNRVWNTTPGGWSPMRRLPPSDGARVGILVVPGQRPNSPAAAMKRCCEICRSKPVARLPAGACCQMAGGFSTCMGMCREWCCGGDWEIRREVASRRSGGRTGGTHRRGSGRGLADIPGSCAGIGPFLGLTGVPATTDLGFRVARGQSRG